MGIYKTKAASEPEILNSSPGAVIIKTYPLDYQYFTS